MIKILARVTRKQFLCDASFPVKPVSPSFPAEPVSPSFPAKPVSPSFPVKPVSLHQYWIHLFHVGVF